MKTESLRERKKYQTRLEIIAAAEELFEAQGYGKTTLAEIAERANIAPRTIFSYFSSKEAIIFNDAQHVLDTVLKRLDNRGDMSVLDCLRALEFPDKSNVNFARRRAIIQKNPPLQQHLASIMAAVEHKITQEIAKENNIEPNSIINHLIGATCRVIIVHAHTYRNGHSKEDLETALQFIEAGLKKVVH